MPSKKPTQPLADSVGKLGEAPAHNAAAHSAALAKHIGKDSPAAVGDPYLVFQQESPESWPPFVRWIRGPLRDKVNSLVTFTGDLKKHLDQVDSRETARHAAVDGRLDVLEEAVRNPPFPG
jgi:hypothetical protein